MLPAANRGAGMNIGFPDPCLTPVGLAVVPIPYPNLAMHATALGFSPNVLVTGMNALGMIAKLPMTMGDEGGVAHPFIKASGMFVMGNPIVHVNMVPAVCLCCPTVGNNFNNPLGAVLVPAVTNVFYTYAQPGVYEHFDRDSKANDVAALAAEVASVGREGGSPVDARMLTKSVGVVTIRVFSADVPARVQCALRELESRGARELVIDLRDDPGGEVTAFVELAGDFLEPGSLVATVVDGEGDETEHRSWQERPCRLPVTIHVNRGTASAAELFADCLAAHGRARVLGGPTFGKRRAQQVVLGADGRARTRTVAEVRTPRPGEG